MSSLTPLEKAKLERILRMEEGYVLRFSDRTFENIFLNVLGILINSPEFKIYGTSKANRMRAFWQSESDKNVAKLLSEIFFNWDDYGSVDGEQPPESFFEIIYRLDPTITNKTKKYMPKSEDKLPNEKCLQSFRDEFKRLSELDPQARGYAFEKFLHDLFIFFDLDPRHSFKLSGEQIDGSFVYSGDTYLLEAKWVNDPIGLNELSVFDGKVATKARWTRGLFISMSGYTEGGLTAFRSGRTLSIVGFDRSDLLMILEGNVSLKKAIDEKVRVAAEEGKFFVPLSELISKGRV